MTTDAHESSTAKRASAAMFGLLLAGLFVFPLSDALGYVLWTLAPVAATVEALGYPAAISRLADRADDRLDRRAEEQA